METYLFDEITISGKKIPDNCFRYLNVTLLEEAEANNKWQSYWDKYKEEPSMETIRGYFSKSKVTHSKYLSAMSSKDYNKDIAEGIYAECKNQLIEIQLKREFSE